MIATRLTISKKVPYLPEAKSSFVFSNTSIAPGSFSQSISEKAEVGIKRAQIAHVIFSDLSAFDFLIALNITSSDELISDALCQLVGLRKIHIGRDMEQDLFRASGL